MGCRLGRKDILIIIIVIIIIKIMIVHIVPLTFWYVGYSPSPLMQKETFCASDKNDDNHNNR